MRRRKVPGIGWMYLSAATALLGLFTGPWDIDPRLLLVIVFAVFALGAWVLAAPGESIDEMEARALADEEASRE